MIGLNMGIAVASVRETGHKCYGIMRPSAGEQWIGPVVASTAAGAARIVAGLTAEAGAAAVSLRVLASARDFRRRLAAQGFRTVALHDVLVRRPQPDEPVGAARPYDLADLAFG